MWGFPFTYTLGCSCNPSSRLFAPQQAQKCEGYSDKRVDFELMQLLGGVWGQEMSPVTSLRSSAVDVHTAQPENVRTSQLQVGETYLLSTQLACLTGFL